MSEEATPSTGQEATPAAQEAPTDYREFVRWREGAQPDPKEETPAAAGEGAAPIAPEPQAKTAPDSGTDGTQDTGEGDDPDKQKRSDSRTRKIDRLTRENAELQQRISTLEQRKPNAEEPGKTPKAPPEGKKPALEDYDTLEAYQEALTDWKLDEREKARTEKQARDEAIEAQEKLQSAWAKKEKAAAKVHDDFDEVVDSVVVPKGPGVHDARQAILEDENGAEILYYLGKHPEELKRIAALSPHSAVREIGRISAQVSSPDTPPVNGKPKVTGAPKPPPSAVRPSKTTTDDLNDPEVVSDYRRWERGRLAQLRSR